MSGEGLKAKLAANARTVDAYIEGALRVRSPEVLYEASRHLIMAGGKRLRPFLTVKACELVGGDPATVVPFAAGMELLHNFTLVHDDVMDNDPTRRGAPTVHTRYGVPVAICAGDLLFAKVYEAFTSGAPNASAKVVRACVEKVTEATIELCEGQVMDVGFPKADGVSEDDYIRMSGGKTSALFRACAEVGAVVGGGSKRQVLALGKFAYASGLAYQIVDDILGVTVDEKTLGKPVGSDLREGKKTLIMIHALKHAKARDRRVLDGVLGNASATPEMFEEAAGVLRGLGSVGYASKRADRYLAEAKKQLARFPDLPAKRDLLELTDFFTQRPN